MIPPSPESIDPVLFQAVNDASRVRLLIVLSDILVKHSDTMKTASEHLLSIVPDDLKINSKRDAPDDSNARPVKVRKRYHFLAQCEDEFDVEVNHAKACNWHKRIHVLEIKSASTYAEQANSR